MTADGGRETRVNPDIVPGRVPKGCAGLKKAAVVLILMGVLGLVLVGWLMAETRRDLLRMPESLPCVHTGIRKPQALDRRGLPLTLTYLNRWNTHADVALHEIPEFLQTAFILSEDKRFYTHRGGDWAARFHALWQNMAALSVVRGASTITEQVVRMIHPRPRTLWSRWVEGLAASRLEKGATKADILEFYLNQVPYAANRRGVVQAADYYFDRDLDTLSRAEMIALAVLVRAPSRLDLYRRPGALRPSIERLAKRLLKAGHLSRNQYRSLMGGALQAARPRLDIDARHFVAHVQTLAPAAVSGNRRRLHTSLDGGLQRIVQKILDQSLAHLRQRRVTNAAALIVDHTTSEILAWVVAGRENDPLPGGLIDAVTAPRQPGSSLKPFLYAAALENAPGGDPQKAWTAATIIDDTPLTASVGFGLHAYHNYNRSFYGPVTLRKALGNSLNIPAIRAIHFVGLEHYLARLRAMGFNSLEQHPDFYGDGLALGNGEVTLFELVQAYTVFARRGLFRPLKVLAEQASGQGEVRIFSEEVTSIIADILSDPAARSLEFGGTGLLNFPLQTAVKTGTSSDYRDAWALGSDYHFTAGVWMGNLDGSRTDGLTGAAGPALVLRSIFAELNRFKDTRPLYISPKLIRLDICGHGGRQTDGGCNRQTEWFIPGTEPQEIDTAPANYPVRLRRPTNGLQLALDPRIPDDREALEFLISGIDPQDRVEWTVDRAAVVSTTGGSYLWPLAKGRHHLKATVWRNHRNLFETDGIHFTVR